MNGELVPAVAAASVGSGMLGMVLVHERLVESRMRRSRKRLALVFPSSLDPAAAKLALGNIAGIERAELVWEVAVSSRGVSHAVLVPEAVRSSVVSGLGAAIPALRVTDAAEPTAGVSRVALRVFVPTPCVLASEHPEAALRNLAGLALLPGERVVVRVAIRPSQPPSLRADEPPGRVAKEAGRRWRQKASVSAGFQVAALGLVQAEGAGRAGVLAGHLASVFRSRRGSVAGLRLTSERGGRSMASLPQTRRSSSGWLGTAELLALLMWPMGEAAIPGVEVGARELAVPRDVPREGRVLFIGRDAGGERPVALDATAARHSMAVVGSSGVGKSVLLANCIISDIENGYGGVVVDPKADLLETILERVRPEHAGRMVVLDPGDDSRPVPGIDVLGGGDPDLRTDVLVGSLRSIFPDWGIRSETYGRLAIRTLSEVPGATLADMGRLFAEEPYRRAAIARLRDPFLVSSWQGYEALSAAAQVEVVQAPMARVMALLSRPRVRAVLANPEPKLDMRRLLAERKWLLCSLAPGVLGEAGAALIGSAVMYAVWSAIEARVALPPEKRSPVFLYVDELATVTNGTPFGFELLAERARGLGAGLTVALQTLGRIPEPTRSALVGNVGTFITFRAVEEAPRLARQVPPLADTDITGLGRFEVAARVSAGAGSGVVVVTGRTQPLPPPAGQAGAIRDLSARLYGAKPQTSQTPPDEAVDDSSLGRTRRQAR